MSLSFKYLVCLYYYTYTYICMYPDEHPLHVRMFYVGPDFTWLLSSRGCLSCISTSGQQGSSLFSSSFYTWPYAQRSLHGIVNWNWSTFLVKSVAQDNFVRQFWCAVQCQMIRWRLDGSVSEDAAAAAAAGAAPCCFKTIAALWPEVRADKHSSRPDMCHLLHPLLGTVITRKNSALSCVIHTL